MDIPISSVVAAVVVVLLTCLYYWVKNRGVPPGPWGFPYLGLWPYMQHKTCHLQLAEYSKEYGDVFSFTFTGKLLINLGSVNAIREAHVNNTECFAQRYSDFNIISHVLEDGVTMISGEPWKLLRKFFHLSFKEYGLSSTRNDTVGPIYDSLTRAIEDLKTRDAPFNIIELLTERCMGTARKVFFGESGISDEQLNTINTAYCASLQGVTGVNLLMMGPFARLVYLISPVHWSYMKAHSLIADVLRNCVKKIESSMDEDDPTCVIEHYYAERNKRRRTNDTTWKEFTDKALVSSLIQFVADGIVGVASFIAMFLNALIEHPEEQDKIYTELKEVVGPSRQPVIEDKINLPYTNAFINEVIRTSAFFPLMPSLECTKETTLRGYRIPKGSITVLNFWSAHHDPETYEDPEKFNPSRFLSISGETRAELPVLFGVGKRSCSGEAFVMMQTFLFLTTIINNFKILESNDPSVTAATFLMSGKLELMIKPRNEK